MIKPLAVLAVLGLVCGTLLTVTNTFTHARISEHRTMAARALLLSLVEEPLPTNSDGRAFGQCDTWRGYRITTPGYAGAIAFLGIWYPNQQLTLRVEQHRETPGIGDFIDHRRDPWITQFDRQPINIYTEIDHISGATITSKAVKRAAELIYQRGETDCEY